MAVYEVAGPDGTVYEIEGPPNAQDSQVIGALRRHLQDQRIQGMQAETERLRALEQQVPAPVAEQSFLRSIADVPLQVGRGGISGAKMLSDAFGAGSSTTETLNTVDNYLDNLLSAQAKNDQQEMSRIMAEAEGHGIGAEVMAALRAFTVAPIDTIAQGLGTAAAPIAAGLTTAAMGAPAAVGTAVLVGTGMLMGAGNIKGQIYETVKDELVQNGVSEEVAEVEALKAQEYQGENLDQIGLGAFLSAAASRLGIEKVFVPQLTKKISSKLANSGVGRFAAITAGEAIPEGIQGGQEKVATNVALQRQGMDVPTFRGAFGQGTLEAATGAGLGAAASPFAPRPAPDTKATDSEEGPSPDDLINAATTDLPPTLPPAGDADIAPKSVPDGVATVPPTVGQGQDPGGLQSDLDILGGTVPVLNPEDQGRLEMAQREAAEAQEELDALARLGFTTSEQHYGVEAAQKRLTASQAIINELVPPPPSTGLSTPFGIPEGTILQNRGRSSPASINQMNNIANKPEYGRIAFSNSFTDGAPVVFGQEQLPANQIGRSGNIFASNSGKTFGIQYGVIEADQIRASNKVDGSTVSEYSDPSVGGFRAINNGRVAGLKEGYTRGNMGKYKQDLINDNMHGIDADVIRGMNNPVLVRVLPPEQVTPDIADESNVSSTLSLNATEQARNDANRIDLGGLKFSPDGGISADTVRGFVASMPLTEQQNLIDANGQPSAQAYNRLRAAVFQKAYQNDGIVALAVQSQDKEVANIINGMSQAAPQMASLDGLGDYDIRASVVEAAEAAVNARRQDIKLTDLLGQGSLISNNPVADEVIKLFANNPRSAKAIGAGLKDIVSAVSAEANLSQEPDMFGNVPPRRSVEEIIAGLSLDPNAVAVTPPTVAQISSQEEKRLALEAFETSLQNTIKPFLAQLTNITSEIKPKPFTQAQIKELVELSSDAIDLGMPASLLANVTAGGSTRLSAIALVVPDDGWLMTGAQWTQQSRDTKIIAIMHEFGHIVDGPQDSSSSHSQQPNWGVANAELKDWYNKKPDQNILSYPFSVQFNGKVDIQSESFAQAFALYFTNPQVLRDNAPKSFAQIHEIVIGIKNGNQRAATAGSQGPTSGAGVHVQPSRAEANGEIQPAASTELPVLGSAQRGDSQSQVESEDVLLQDIQKGVEGVPQPSVEFQRTGIISTPQDVDALHEDIRDAKIREYQALKQGLSAIQRRFIENRSKQFDDPTYRSLYIAAEQLKSEIDATKPVKSTPEDFMARAAKALADGDIDRDVYDVVDLMFKKNPAFLNGLRLSVRASGTQGVAGQFNTLARIVLLFKGTEGVLSPGVVRHELTHSMEQMMTPEVRQKIVDKWRSDLDKMMKTDKSEQAQKYFDAVMKFIENPTNATQNAAKKELPDYRYYQYLNPSEYWAVNAEPLMNSYLGSPWQRFKTSLRGMLESIKSVLGLDNSSEVYAAFKSAINGEREGSTVLIDYIRSNAPINQIQHRNYKGNPAPLPTWEAPPETLLPGQFGGVTKQSLKQKFVDKMVDLVDFEKAITEQRGEIKDFMDAAGKETLYHGKVARIEDQFLGQDVQPLLKEMKAKNITSQEFGAYALALHAKERNEKIAKINPKFGDGGSGIDTARAEEYLARLDPDKKKALESINQKVRKIIEGTQDLEVKYGLTDKATIEAGRLAYPNYVPLFREEVDYTAGGSGLGQGLDVRGATSKRAVGSARSVKDILNSVIEQRQRAIIRGEKNLVGNALYALSIANPNSTVWLPINPEAIKDVSALSEEMLAMGLDPKDAENLMQAPKVAQVVRMKDPKTGEYYEQVKYVVSPSANFSENVISTRVNGQNRYVIFNPNNERAVRLVRSLKNLETEQLDYLTQKMGNVTRWIASMSTQYNPIFGLWNFIRDLQGAALNLSTTPLKGQEGEVLRGAFKMLPQMYAEYRASRRGGESKGEFAKLLRLFRDAGAQTGYRDQFARAEKNGTVLQQQLLKLNAGNVRQTVNAVANWLSDYNDMLENAVRLSAFQKALAMGLSVQQSAIIAKNLTVNFNRKGSKTPGLSAWYAFFNAAVQSIDRMVTTLKGPSGKKIIAGGLALGAVQALVLQAFDFGEDEPNEFIKQKNLIIPTGNGGYLMWPMPLGFNFLPNTGRILTEMVFDGRTKARDRVVDLMGAMVDAFNPLGGAGFMQTLTPTPIDPFIAISENRDAFGRPISRESQATNPSPGYLRSRDNSNEFSKLFAEALNSMSGGTEFTKGVVSPTADDIDYVVGQYLGGVSREVQKIYQLGKSQATGEDVEQFRVPILGKLYGETTSPAAIASNFYRTIIRMSEHESEIKGRAEKGESTEAYVTANPESRLYGAANRVENHVSQLNRSIREMRKADSKDIRIKLLEDRKAEVMQMFLDRLNEQFPNQ